MNKKGIFILALITFVLALSIGSIIANNNKQNEIIKNDMAFKKQNEIIQDNEILKTSVQEERITPSTKLTLQKHYNKCGHTISNNVEIFSEMINLNKEELKEKYADWDVEKFSQSEVILTKTLEGLCGEHYYITEENDYISIYILDEENKKTLKETGKIPCEYLPETDRINLRNGIILFGTQELNKMLENYE